MPRIALIDGDEALYKACVMKKEDVDWDSGDMTKRPPTFAEARDNLDFLIEAWSTAAGCDSAIVCLSPTDRKLYRRSLFPTYKGGRSEKPEHFWELDAYARKSYDGRDIPGLEADDVLGLLAESPDTHVICSTDKDMLTVPARIYSPMKDKIGVVSPARADWQWMFQTLTGDSTDGYGGCPKIGPVKAEAILDDGLGGLDGMWSRVLGAFALKGLDHAYALTQAKLARIVRFGEFDPHSQIVAYRLGGTDVRINALDE